MCAMQMSLDTLYAGKVFKSKRYYRIHMHKCFAQLQYNFIPKKKMIDLLLSNSEYKESRVENI